MPHFLLHCISLSGWQLSYLANQPCESALNSFN
jgi:hypothetical protein